MERRGHPPIEGGLLEGVGGSREEVKASRAAGLKNGRRKSVGKGCRSEQGFPRDRRQSPDGDAAPHGQGRAAAGGDGALLSAVRHGPCFSKPGSRQQALDPGSGLQRWLPAAPPAQSPLFASSPGDRNPCAHWLCPFGPLLLEPTALVKALQPVSQ